MWLAVLRNGCARKTIELNTLGRLKLSNQPNVRHLAADSNSNAVLTAHHVQSTNSIERNAGDSTQRKLVVSNECDCNQYDRAGDWHRLNSNARR